MTSSSRTVNDVLQPAQQRLPFNARSDAAFPPENQETRQRPFVLKRPSFASSNSHQDSGMPGERLQTRGNFELVSGQRTRGNPETHAGQTEMRNGCEAQSNPPLSFRTAREKLIIDRKQQQQRQEPSPNLEYGVSKRSLGTTARSRGVTGRFVPPVANPNNQNDDSPGHGTSSFTGSSRGTSAQNNDPVEEQDERLQGLEPRMVELIRSEIMDHGPSIGWDDIAGLEFAKTTIKEIVIFPMLRPDIFTGLRGPPKGLLLFGPPGTGKTLIGKCIASQSRSTFFSISASTLTSKFVGEGEKMVRALFAVARVHQPSVVFMDEIDSLLTQRSEQEHESSRRIKTEFLVQLDGVATSSEERILVVGATNRPQEIDEAARRRFVKRLYIPLPCELARRQIVENLLREQRHDVSDGAMRWITEATDGYSGADVANLCREAAMGPVRSLPFDCINEIRPEDVRPISRSDFDEALTQVRASVSTKDLELYIKWNERYGSFKRATS